jgi:hypothetical protein
MDSLTHWQLFVVSSLSTLPAILSGLAGLIVALRRIDTVHAIVNQQRTDMIAEIERLKEIINEMKKATTIVRGL